MSEQPPALPEQSQLSDPVDFNVDDWIAGGKISERSVDVYSKPGLRARYDDLARQYDTALAARDAAPGTDMGDTTIPDLVEQLDAVRQEFLDSKVTWYVRALDSDDTDAIRDAVDASGHAKPGDAPAGPEPLPDDATDEDRAAHAEKVKAHEKALRAHQRAVEEFKLERDAQLIARATTRLVHPGGRVATSVTVEQVKALHKVLGRPQVMPLLGAIGQATAEEPEVPIPFWLEPSPDDQT